MTEYRVPEVLREDDEDKDSDEFPVPEVLREDDE
jgi:hypothetical protein